jgi:hypothetical protein
VIAPIGRTVVSLGQLSGGDPYQEGRAWVQGPAPWEPSPGDLAFRAIFVARP